MTEKLNKQELIVAIDAAITPAITAAGCYLEEITIVPAGKSRILTVIVDSDTHLNLDQVTAVSRGISEITETLEALGDQPFTLEVTSPGIDRPLTLPRHWRKNHGRLVAVVMNDGSEAKGRIGDAHENSAIVGDHSINFADVKKAVLEIEFKSLKGDSE
ncbi:MAG: hypothetical protein WCH42_02375 [Actinomycetes bacterium]